MESQVTTVTIMSVTDREGTFAITSKVIESVTSALDHVRAIGEWRSEPVYVTGQAGWRWTWEYVDRDTGARCTDTVRVY